MASHSDTNKPIPYSKRAIKAVPIPQGRSATQERRRDLFLKKVQQDRDEKRWEARGDQIMKLDFVAERRRWEAEQARAAPNPDEPSEDSEYGEGYNDLPMWSSQQTEARRSSQPEEEAEAVIQQENEELDAMISMMEEQGQTSQTSSIGSPGFGSDDEDYDIIFSEILGARSTPQLLDTDSAFNVPDADAMDTTNG
ncbi:hypothetical protein W97_02038 [Coniosporium apollinis CBS 100218]|uniref:Uncharacterized protein n=1 Tax=Coniosporium apollinis (strain CBS 100218) TaxID=1168221 RepID=R7YLQ9_CONA1|nr:uncharacterized protein W97_02038 [Coniosporium apollinis CBS 100218]EON62813.1 hypothetical protein W97_02038 [Coniosporium apollinis CBS 100218]